MQKLALFLFLAIAVSACSSTEEVPVVAGGPGGREMSPDSLAPEDVPEQSLTDPNRIVARVNDQIITVRALRSRTGVEEALQSLGQPTTEQISALLDRAAFGLIQEELQVAAARRLGIQVTRDDLDRQIEEAEKDARKRNTTFDEDLQARGIALWEWEELKTREILAGRFRAVSLGQIMAPTAELRATVDVWVRPVEVRSFYERHQVDFKKEELARVSAIFIRRAEFAEGALSAEDADERTRQFANGVVSRARRGESFDLLVTEIQGEPIAAFAEPFKRGDQVDYVEEFTWNAKPGDVSDPIQRRFGYVILKLVEYQPEQIPTFDQVRDLIFERFQTLKLQAAVLKVQSDLLRASVVTPKVFERQLTLLFEEQSARVLEELAK